MLNKLINKVFGKSEKGKLSKQDESAWFDKKVAGGGERQASPQLEGIREDHTGRYYFAAKYIPEDSVILDMACGVGYGSYILATQTGCKNILSVDLSEDAIKYANQFYGSEKIKYQQDNCLTINLDDNSFDVIVSFETVEHIKEDQKLLERFYLALKPKGKLVLSTPNELMMPFNPQNFPFHIRHYTPTQLDKLVKKAAFLIDEVFSQPDNQSSDIVEGWDGKFNILVCSKPEL